MVLALLFTLLNAFKPICIDDASYYLNARQLAEHPLQPDQFRLFWNQRPGPAMKVMVPLGLPYWLAAGLGFLKDSPFLWKLWLLPSALLLGFRYIIFAGDLRRGTS
ncbi:MAG TPA: hypothetical protein VGN86_10905 [Pyrinomonadaceae bacterium]|nr:hypothetical protein [Pyrinomonadaceae bacterium]